MSIRKALLLSSSSVHGYGYLEYAKGEITAFLKGNNVSWVLFIPYALFDFDDYTQKVKTALASFGFDVKGIHTFKSLEKAVDEAQCIYIGGGNTFKLLSSLHDNNLVERIRRRVCEEGIPYIGSSAGTNVATINICTTNDMPIVYPPTFNAIGIVPFNINPHYVDPDSNSTHKGETREERIQQFHQIPKNLATVVGLREGSLLHLEGNKLTLKGAKAARIFFKNKKPIEYEGGSDLSFLLEEQSA